KVRPEIPVAVRAPHASPRITFDRMVQIRKLQRIAKEEDRSIVTHKVPVALVRIELQRESTDVSLGVRGATLAGDGRKARKHFGLLPDLGEDLRLGVLGDVMGNREGAEAPEPLACIRRSGITSRSKCASFSRNQMFWSNAGPRSPAVAMF